MIAIERLLAAGADAVAIAHGGPVEAPRQRHAPRIAERHGVGREDAPRADQPVEIDAGVVRLAVDAAARESIAERVRSRHAAIGIEIAELRRLPEVDMTLIVGSADRELV